MTEELGRWRPRRPSARASPSRSRPPSASTLLMAAPVVLAPSERLFGSGEVLGREDPNRDALVVIEQLRSGRVPAPYLQPLTDLPGRALARLVGPVAAYNVLVLATFPLSAAAAYLLARHVVGSHLGAMVAGAGLCVPALPRRAGRRPSPRRADAVAPAVLPGLVALRRPSRISAAPRCCSSPRRRRSRSSNFYGGFIAAVLSPVALVAYGGRLAAPAGRGPLAARGDHGPRARGGGRGRPRRSSTAFAPAVLLRPGSLRLPALGALRLEREVVELPGPPGRTTRCWGPASGSSGPRRGVGASAPRAPAGGRGLVAPRAGGRAALALAARRSGLARGPQRSRAGDRRRAPPSSARSLPSGAIGSVHLRAPVRAAVRGGADVPGLCAVRRGGRPHDRAAGGSGRRAVCGAGPRPPAGARPRSSWAWPSWNTRPSLPGGGATCCRPAPTDGSRRSPAPCACWIACLRPECPTPWPSRCSATRPRCSARRPSTTAASRGSGTSWRRWATPTSWCGGTARSGRWLAADPAPEGLARGPEFEDGWILEVKAEPPARVRGRDARLLPSRIRGGRPPGAGWGRRGRCGSSRHESRRGPCWSWS